MKDLGVKHVTTHIFVFYSKELTLAVPVSVFIFDKLIIQLLVFHQENTFSFGTKLYQDVVCKTETSDS